MSPETFLALATLGSTAFTFTVGFIAGRAWAAWRVRQQAARISARLQAAHGNWQSLCKPCHDVKRATEDGGLAPPQSPMLGEGTCIHGKGFQCVTCWPHPAAPSDGIGSSKEGG